MEQNIVQTLMNSIREHKTITPGLLQDEHLAKLEQALMYTVVPESRRFYEELKSPEIVRPDTANSLTYTFSLRRVLRNGQAELYAPSLPKRLWGVLTSKVGIYDSNTLTRSLRSDEDIVRMMRESGETHSLLGRLDILNEISGSVQWRPLLMIPHAQEITKVLSWEEANTQHFDEFYRKITKAQFEGNY